MTATLYFRSLGWHSWRKR